MPDAPSAQTPAKTPSRRSPVTIAGIALLSLFTAITLALIVGVKIDLSDYRTTINDTLSSTLGRTTTIKGDMQLTLSFTPSIVLNDITIANTDSSAPPMFSGTMVKAKIAALPLLTGEVAIDSADIQSLLLNLSRDKEGNPNWLLGNPSTPPAPPASEHPQKGLFPFTFTIDDRILLSDIRLVYDDQSTGTVVEGSLSALTVLNEGDQWQVNAEGDALGMPYAIAMKGDIEALINDKTAKLHFSGDYAGAQLAVDANVQPFAKGRNDATLSLIWHDATALKRLLDLDITPATPAILKTTLVVGNDYLAMPALSLSSPVANAKGQLRLTRGTPNTIEGALTIPAIDFTPWVEEAAQPKPMMFGARSAPPRKSPLQRALDQWLVNTSTRVAVTLGEVKGLGADIRHIGLQVMGKEGILSAPMTATIADVPFKGEAHIDGSGWVSTAKVSLSANNAPLGTMAEWLTGINNAKGHLQNGELAITTHGSKLKEWISNSQLNFALTDTQLTWGKQASWAIDKAAFVAGMNVPTTMTVDGQLMGIPAALNMSGGTLLDALARRNWQTALAFNSPAITVNAKGELVAGQWQNGSWLDMRVNSKDVAALSPWLGTRADIHGPLKITGQLKTDGQWATFGMQPMQLINSKGTVSARWRLDPAHPFLGVDAHLKTLDLSRLSKWLTPSTQAPKSTSDTPPAGLQLDVPLLSSEIVIADADLNLSLDKLQWENKTLHTLSLKGNVRDGWLKRAPFSANYAEGHYSGDMQLDLRKQLIKAQFNLSVEHPNIGLMMADAGVTDALDMSLDSASLTMTLQGYTLDALFNTATIEAHLKSGLWHLPDGYTGKSFALDITDGTFMTGPHTETQLRLNGQAADTPLTLNIDTLSLAKIRDGRSKVPVTVNLALGDMTFNAETSVGFPLTRQEATLALHANIPNLDRLNEFTGIDLPPYGPITVAGNLAMTTRGYELNDLLLKVKSSYLKGDMRFLPGSGQTKPALTVALSAPFIQLDDFRAKDWAPWQTTATADSHTTDDGNKTAMLLSPETLNLLNADFTLDVGEVRSGNDWLGAGELHWRLTNGQLDVDPFAIDLPGGHIAFSSTIKAVNNAFDISLKGGATHFNYGVLARYIKPDTPMSGSISLDVDVHSQSTTPDDVLNNATGTLAFSVWPEAFEAGVIDLWAVGLVDAVLPTLNKENTSMLNCAAGAFTLNAGHMKQKKVLLDTSRIQVSGDVDVDFSNKHVKLYLTPRSKKAEVFSLQTPIEVSGSFEHFSLGIPLSAILKTSVQFTTSPVISPMRWLFENPIPRDGSAYCEQIMNQR